MSLAFYDGQFVQASTIKISPLDFGFSRGVALFDFARIYGGIPFRLEDHIERMRRGAELLDLTLPYTSEEITKAVRHLSEKNRYAQSTVKFYLTAGEPAHVEGFGFGGYSEFTPHFMLLEDEVHPLDPSAPKGKEFHERGLKIKTVPFARDFALAKITFYLPGYLAARKLAGPECDEILFTHADGFVTETPTANFFCVIDGILCTPNHEMLYGVTRKVIIELAIHLGLPYAERKMTLADIGRASEAFLSNSYSEMMPIRKINDTAFATTTEGPIYKKLRSALTRYIEEYCEAQS
jgi:branched-subunit amino acid aminotransferase/4-amino-4-deoxychorismate lyase